MKINEEILLEVKDIIQNERLILPVQDISLLLKFITFSIDNEELKGIETRMLNALEKILISPISRVDKNSFFPDVAKIEPFLRKLVYLIDPKKYYELLHNKQGLAAFISYLELNPNNINYTWQSLTPNQSTNLAEHLLSSYNLRNVESHACKNWSSYQLHKELRSLLAIYLFTIAKHRTAINIIISKESYETYLNKEIKKYNLLSKTFIHIEGKETVYNVNIFVKEIQHFENLEQDDIELREGTVEFLKDTIVERKMIVLGEVGMGKTTSLVYLHLKDCEKAIKNFDNHKVPIYIELKNMVRNETLVEKIINKIGLNKEIIISDLKKGKFNIYLDGLNEIEKEHKNVAITEIRNLLETFPNNFFLLSSRPHSYSGQFDTSSFGKSIPIFQLLKMNDSQMIEFLDKNCDLKNKKTILSEIENNNKLKQIVSTPLMLAMLVSVVSIEGNIPKDKAKILRSFMYSLYNRETKQEASFQVEEFHVLLCCLGFQSRDLTGTNSGLNKNQYVLPILQEEKSSLGLEVNLLNFLRKAMDLNILVSDNDHISFTHEIYQEYYAAEYLFNKKGAH